MLLAFVYQVWKNGGWEFQHVELRANLNKFIKQATAVREEDNNIRYKWNVYRKLAKNEEVFPL